MLLLRLFSPALLLVAWPASGQDYRVSLSFDSARPMAAVRAELTTPDGKLFTHKHAGGYEWSDYIRNLRAFRADGTALVLQPAGTGQWLVPVAPGEHFRVVYDVDLAFTQPVREGAQRGGQFFGRSLYLVNRALFVMSDAPGPRHVAFDLPAGVAVATPWKRDGRLGYVVQDNSELADNTTVFGTFPIFAVDEGSFHLVIVLPGGTSADRALIEPVVRPVLREYLRMFPETPDFHVMLSYFRGIEVNGESYRDSAALTYPGPIEAANRVLWASYLAHELFHHWNGGLIAGADEGTNFGTSEWFAEGGTEYVANRTLARAGIIDRAGFFNKMTDNISLYEFWTWADAFRGTSLRDAGSKTALPVPHGVIAKTYNRPGVYNGGWVATFCLDTMIARDSGGRRDIDDLFRLLLDRYGLKGRRWTPDDFVHAASEVDGHDLSPFFARYIDAAVPLPIETCWNNAGLEGLNLNYGGETYVHVSAAGGRSAMRIGDHIWSAAPVR
jgi:predicted metalloprotease with PDZ domain